MNNLIEELAGKFDDVEMFREYILILMNDITLNINDSINLNINSISNEFNNINLLLDNQKSNYKKNIRSNINNIITALQFQDKVNQQLLILSKLSKLLISISNLSIINLLKELFEILTLSEIEQNFINILIEKKVIIRNDVIILENISNNQDELF